MPYKHTQQNGGENKGNPSGQGQDKAGGKPVNPGQSDAEHEELKNKYTEGADEAAQNVQTNNPNRNLDKPDLDNNKYN